MSGKVILNQTYDIIAGDYIVAGEASSKIKATLKKLGVDADLIRRIAVSSYESEMNIVIHSHGGIISLAITKDEIILTSKDSGPGIADIKLALQEGYSTAPEKARNFGFGAGMGLPNIKRCSDQFNITSDVESGTTLIMHYKLV